MPNSVLILVLVICLLICQQIHAAALPATIVGHDVPSQPIYDFVIVGGGTAGLTVADRLTENPQSMFSSTT